MSASLNESFLKSEKSKCFCPGASQVVDANGEPLVLYHGSQSFGFTEFNEQGRRGFNGIFLTPHLGTARSYAHGAYPKALPTKEETSADDYEFEPGTGVYPLFANVRNPHEAWFEGANWDGSFADRYEVFSEDGEKQYREDGNGYFTDREAEAFADELSEETGQSYRWEEAYGIGDSTDSVAKEAARYGSDGAIIHDVTDDGGRGGSAEATDVYVVFDGSNLKSATDNDGSYSGSPDIRFRRRTKPAPEKTGIAYKVFFVKDGKLYPPMVNPTGEDTPIGVWLDAENGVSAGQSKTGRPKVKAGGKGTQGGGGTLSYRPGWHLGDIPRASQFDRTDPATGESSLFPKDFVWGEVEYAADRDYQDEAMSYGKTASGGFINSYAGLPRVPEDGFYRYRTNPRPDTVPWIITGAIKVKRILGDSDVAEHYHPIEKSQEPPCFMGFSGVFLDGFTPHIIP